MPGIFWLSVTMQQMLCCYYLFLSLVDFNPGRREEALQLEKKPSSCYDALIDLFFQSDQRLTEPECCYQRQKSHVFKITPRKETWKTAGDLYV